MAQIDSLFQFLISQGGHELLVPADDNCQIVDAAGKHPINRVMSAREVGDLLQEVLSGPDAAEWAANRPVELLRRSEVGCFRVRAEWREDGPHLSLAPTALDHVERLVRAARDADAGELILSEGGPAFVRRDGVPGALPDGNALPAGVLSEFLRQCAHAADALPARFLVDLEGPGRTRVAWCGPESAPTVALRFLPDTACPPTDLPGAFREMLFQRSGLVLAATPSGQGLTRLLAGLLSMVAAGWPAHVISIEELAEVPVEPGKALLTRWEIGPSGDRPEAIRAAMALHPEVLFVDEIADARTLLACMDAGQAGALVVAGCRGRTVAVALARLLALLPPPERAESRECLAELLRGAVAQVLCRGADGRLLPVREVLITLPGSAEAIRSGRFEEVEESIRAVGFSLDDALVRLVAEGKVLLSEAEAVSADRKHLRDEVATRARRETAHG